MKRIKGELTFTGQRQAVSIPRRDTSHVGCMQRNRVLDLIRAFYRSLRPRPAVDGSIDPHVPAIVAALYRKILLREPEPAGLAAHVEHVKLHGLGPDEMLDGVFRAAEFEHVAPLLIHRYLRSPKLIWDHSQNGEVEFLIRSMINDSARRRQVVDVGARGRERSNSYDLLKYFGWTGLLVEANPNLIPQIRDDFDGLNFELKNCAVADYDGRANFYFGMNDDVSSLYKETSEAWGDLRGECVVDVRRLPGLLAEAGVAEDFDLLSLDIEGADIPVLNDLIATSSYRPLRVIMEVFGSQSVQRMSDLPLHQSVIQEYSFVGPVGANVVLRHKSIDPITD